MVLVIDFEDGVEDGRCFHKGCGGDEGFGVFLKS